MSRLGMVCLQSCHVVVLTENDVMFLRVYTQSHVMLSVLKVVLVYVCPNDVMLIVQKVM